VADRKFRVLIVEDEMLVAMNIEDMLADIGHEVVGIANRLDAGLELAREGGFDVAMLDVNLAGDLSFPIADILEQRGIPYLFATGYGRKGIRDDYGAAPVLQKPFRARALEQAIMVAAGPVKARCRRFNRAPSVWRRNRERRTIRPRPAAERKRRSPHGRRRY